MNAALYKRHRFPGAVLSHCVWLYHRFCLSFRDIEGAQPKRGYPQLADRHTRRGEPLLETFFTTLLL